MITRNILTSGLLCLSSISSFGWGQKGHDTTAFIAECHLTPTTLDKVMDLLDGKSPVYYANWLIMLLIHRNMHILKRGIIKNIDADQTFDSAPLHEDGDIVRAIYMQVDVLKDSNASRENKQLALKILIHLLGDIHQPMHLGHASDLGGNRWLVKYFGKDTNLHSVWDSSLPESAHKWSYTEWQNQIDRATPEMTLDILDVTTPEGWASETFEIGKDVYNNTPEGTKISYDYIAEWTPIVEKQFLRGGLRLADLLNSIFDPVYSGKNTIVTK